MSKYQVEVMRRRYGCEERADPEMKKIDLSSDSCRPELREEFWKKQRKAWNHGIESVSLISVKTVTML